VLLPTRTWGRACKQLASQLQPGDELLVICDTTADPVARHDPPEGVEILIAGEPEGCSAKANALAYGLERAHHDRFVWADDDYDRAADWLDRLVMLGERHGPAAYEPLIVSDGWGFKLLEPVLALGIAVYDVYRDGGTGGYPWGGGVTFTRAELTEPLAHLCGELRQCVSDDNALARYLSETYSPRDWTIRIPVDGGPTDTVNRLIRWMRADHVRDGVGRQGLVAGLVAGLALLLPFVVAPLVTIAAGLSYRKLGYTRWTFLLAYPGLLVTPAVFAAGLCCRTFDWGGRRYRLVGLYDVEILGPEA
jgi:hypothetical protein